MVVVQISASDGASGRSVRGPEVKLFLESAGCPVIKAIVFFSSFNLPFSCFSCMLEVFMFKKMITMVTQLSVTGFVNGGIK